MRRTAKKAGAAAGKMRAKKARAISKARSRAGAKMARARIRKKTGKGKTDLLSRVNFAPHSDASGSSHYPVGFKPYAGIGVRVRKEPLEEAPKRGRRGASA